MQVFKLFTSKSVAAGANADSQEIPLKPYFNQHSIYYKVTGSGTLKITIYESFPGGDDVKVGEYTGITAGTAIEPLALKPATALKFNIEETGGANSVTVTLWLLQTGGDRSNLLDWT